MSESVAIIPVEQVQMMAVNAAKSRLFGVETQEQAFTLMLLCQAEGLHPMDALKRYHIIKGRPSMRADAMLAEYRKRGGRVKWVERTEKSVRAIFTNPDGDVSPEIWWDDDRVKRAGIGGGNHNAYPIQMKTARVISEGVRLMMPEIVAGIYSEAEIDDMDRPRIPIDSSAAIVDVGPTPEQAYLDRLSAAADNDPMIWQSPDPKTPATGIAVAKRRIQVARDMDTLMNLSDRVERSRFSPEDAAELRAMIETRANHIRAEGGGQ